MLLIGAASRLEAYAVAPIMIGGMPVPGVLGEKKVGRHTVGLYVDLRAVIE